ncbi:MAG: ATP-binding protein [Halapricum sp.]
MTTSYGVYYIWKYGRTLQVTTFTVLATTITIWTFFAMLQLTATTYSLSFWAYKMLHFGSFTTSPAVFFYALSMGRARRWVNWTTVSVVVLLLLPAFGWLFIDPVPTLIVEPRLVSFGAFSVIEHENSPIYVSYLSAFYLLATAGLSYIMYQTWTDRSISRHQTAILVPAIFAPMLLSVAQTFQLLPFETPGTILTPTSFSIGMAGVGYAAFRYETFDTKSLARSRTIEKMNEGYLLANTDGNIIDANQSAGSLLEHGEPLHGMHVSTLFPAIDERSLIEAETPLSFETDVETENGKRTLEVSTSKFVTNGQALGTLFVMRDITARREAKQQLETQRDNIALLDQMVRHDIRNHLQGVLGGVDLLAAETELSDGGERYAEMITNNAENAVDLTTTARELADIMLEPESEIESVNLAPSLLDEVDAIRNSFDDATVNIDGSIPRVSVQASEMLGSVFRNLLKNAIQHNDSTLPEVTLSAVENDEDVHISVADNGPGIPDSQKEQIFGKGETGLDSEGTGIGLYLVNTLVESYGGSISVRDNDPRGTIFTVSLPLA